MAIAARARLGPYEVIALLGAGGMGEVYRARDNRLHRDVAVKLLPATYRHDSERLLRFEQEARALGALNHPNLLAIYDIGEHDGTPFLVTELVEGQSLRQVLDGAGTRLTVRKALDYGCQIAEGLAAAHARGILHRDLKPENIVITPEGRAKVLDFGLARLLSDDSRGSLSAETRAVTEVGVVLGTMGYMAPEQLRGQSVDHRVDLFALGCVLHEMLAGRRPFEGATPADVTTAILKEDPPQLSALADIPHALASVVLRCVEKEPAARFQSAADLAFALRTLSVSATGAVGVTPADEPSPSERPSRRQGRRLATRELIAWTIAAIALVFAAFLIVPDASRPSRAVTDAPRAIRSELDAPAGVGSAAIPSISPDGRYVAFRGPATGFYLRALDEPAARPLSGTEGGYRACWSPDSRALAFIAANRLKTIAIPGGQVSIVGPAPWIATSCAWSPDGEIVVSSQLIPLTSVRASDGAVRRLQRTTLGPARYTLGSFLPDGRHFLFTVAGEAESVVNGAYVGDLADQEAPVRLPDAPSLGIPIYTGGHVLFIRGDVLFARAFDATSRSFTSEPRPLVEGVGSRNAIGVSASENGLLVIDQQVIQPTARLDLVDRKGQRVRTLDTNMSAFAVSPDGSRVAVAKTDGLWLTDISRPAAVRITRERASYLSVAWSPDGHHVTFTRTAPGGPRLYRRSVRVDQEEQVFDGGDDVYPGTVVSTAQGTLIRVLPKVIGSSFDLMWLRAGGSLEPFMQTQDNEAGMAVSPDERWVAYESDAGGEWNVYVKSVSGSSPSLRVTQTGGRQPRWRKDGRELFFLTPDLRVVSLKVEAADSSLRFSGGTELFRYPSPLDWHSLLRILYPVFDVTPDGQSFVVRVETYEAKPLVLIQNWPALLKK